MFFNVVLILLLGAGAAIYEVPRLREEQMKRELFVFSVLLLVGVSSALALALDLPVPNPIRAVVFVFKPLVDLIGHR